MSEQRFVSVKALKDKFEEWSLIGELSIEEIGGVIDETPAIDPETLPIVKELRESSARWGRYCAKKAQESRLLKGKLEDAEKKLAECEPKHGHWIETSFGEECSRCGYLPKFRKDDARLYCQSCGAIMDEAVE